MDHHPEYLAIVREYLFRVGVYLEENGHIDPNTSLDIKYLCQRVRRPREVDGHPFVLLIRFVTPNNVRLCNIEGRVGLYSPGPDDA